MNIDLFLFNSIHSHAKKSKVLDVLAVWSAEYLGYAIVALLFTVAYMTGVWEFFFIPLLTGFVSRFLVTQGIYLFYRRQRPVEALPITALIKKPNHPSFPSGHASFFFGFSLAILFFNIPLALYCTILAVIMCLGRVFCGVHWPSDILAGFIVAAVVCAVAAPFVTIPY